jgi:hypothetical protein
VSLQRRLEALEERAMSRRHVPEPMLRQSDARRRMTEHLDRYAAWRRAGSPNTEEGRELQALSEAFRRRRAELRGEGYKL